MKTLIEPPDGIIVTLPQKFFEEHDHATYLKELEACNVDSVWFRACKLLPKQDVAYVYTVIDNKIHHRAQLVMYERNVTRTFPRPNGGHKTFENSNFIVTTGPIVMAPYEIVKQGFQGFRYTQFIF